MGYADRERGMRMKCTFEGCPGEYERRKIIHAVRHRGKLIVIDGVPADVCTACGDVLLDADTVRQIERLLESPEPPQRTAPVYEYS
jgi:YgiT-type zinc finger domain-containing protein